VEWSLVAVRCRLLLGVDTRWVVLELLLGAPSVDESAGAHVERQQEIIDVLVRDGRPTGEALVELAGLRCAASLCSRSSLGELVDVLGKPIGRRG